MNTFSDSEFRFEVVEGDAPANWDELDCLTGGSIYQTSGYLKMDDDPGTARLYILVGRGRPLPPCWGS